MSTQASHPAAPAAPSHWARALLHHARAAVFGNLGHALELIALRRRDARVWRGGVGALVALFVVHGLIGLAYEVYAVGWRSVRVNVYALPEVSFWALPALLGAALLAVLVPAARSTPGADAGRPASLAVMAFALSCWDAASNAVLAVATDFLPPAAEPLVNRYYPLLSWLPLIWVSLAFAVAAQRQLGASEPWRRAGVLMLAIGCLITPQWSVDPSAQLWTDDGGGEAGGGDRAPTGSDTAQSEATLYGQFDLLNDALDAIAPGQDGVTELYTISFAGDGAQDVFLNEAIGADAVMAATFDSGEHSLVLANSLSHPQERPFATVSALERALSELATRMNTAEDVLALFISSHGSRDHHVVVALPPYQFEDLSPDRLRRLLDEAGIRFRVIIVSACYSGGFIEPLAGPDTMVITASSADRSSFGCRDGAQWTDFGRAYFQEGLAQSASFEGAFRLAQGRIAQREAAEGVTASQPQIFAGPGIREQLQRLETRHGGRILFASSPPPRGAGSQHEHAKGG